MTNKIDLNRASVTEIETIPGLTRTLAKRIVTLRNQRKGFVDMSELKALPGIDGPIFQALDSHGRIESSQAATAARPPGRPKKSPSTSTPTGKILVAMQATG
jgi:Helix-hairpin-helix motif